MCRIGEPNILIVNGVAEGSCLFFLVALSGGFDDVIGGDGRLNIGQWF